jgi:hypothetical protein
MDKLRLACLTTLTWTFFAFFPSPAAAQVELDFDATGVLVSGVTAGEGVLILGTGRERHGLVGHQFHLSDKVVDSDLDGSVRWERGEPIPAGSTWAAVDLSTGGWDLESPGPAVLGKAPPPDVVELYLNRVTVAWSALDFWLVRPSQKSSDALFWGDYLVEGKVRDGDQVANGVLVVQLVNLPFMDPGGVPPPGALQVGDVVVGVHPQTFDFFVRTVTP